MSTFAKDRELSGLATKVTLAFRILRVTQRDLEVISSEEGWDAAVKAHQEGHGEDPQSVRRARIKAQDAADTEFWDAMRELDKAIG